MPAAPRRLGEFPDRAALAGSLSASLSQALEVLTTVAASHGWSLFLVGGSVRDLLLERRIMDLDVAVEGDAGTLARDAAVALGAVVRTHPRFLTATLTLTDASRLDLARTRRETYAAPGHLPTVSPAPIAEDLWRRDFSVNAMALRVEEKGLELLDPCGGLDDLRDGRLRVLHCASFRDDPTRALRGVRFELRFGFRLVRETQEQLKEALASPAFAAVSGARYAAELKLLSEEPSGLNRGLARCAELGLLTPIHHQLYGSPKTRQWLDSARVALFELGDSQGGDSAHYRLLLLGLALELGPEERPELASRLEIPRIHAVLVSEGPGRVQLAVAALRADTLPHEAARLLEPLTREELAFVLGAGGLPERWARRYWSELRFVDVQLTARELLAEGIAAGPRLGAVLREVRDAKLDGRIGDGGELAFAQAWLARQPG